MKTLIITTILLASRVCYGATKARLSAAMSTFNAGTDVLSVSNGVLTAGFDDLSVTPVIDGSTGINTSVDFSAIFDRPADLNDLVQGAFVIADFSSQWQQHHRISASRLISSKMRLLQSVTLLEGNFTSFSS